MHSTLRSKWFSKMGKMISTDVSIAFSVFWVYLANDILFATPIALWQKQEVGESC